MGVVRRIPYEAGPPAAERPALIARLEKELAEIEANEEAVVDATHRSAALSQQRARAFLEGSETFRFWCAVAGLEPDEVRRRVAAMIDTGQRFAAGAGGVPEIVAELQEAHSRRQTLREAVTELENGSGVRPPDWRVLEAQARGPVRRLARPVGSKPDRGEACAA